MQLSSLGSGSKGNATVLNMGGLTLMIDCGFGLKDTVSRLESIDRMPDEVDAILVTHEHTDHISGVEALAARFGIPVYMTKGTSNSWKSRGRVVPNVISAEQKFTIGKVEVLPVAVPHDAREPVQFVFCHAKSKVGVLTDLGSLTPHVVDAYTDCHALLVEANHDLEMLSNGPYPASLKRRVAGPWGHLNNQQTAELVNLVNVNKRLKHLIVGHISQQNNLSELAADALDASIQSLDQVLYASQDKPMNWVDFS